MKDNKGAPKMKSRGEFGHAYKVDKIQTTNSEKYDMGRMQKMPMNKRGYDSKAYSYEY